MTSSGTTMLRLASIEVVTTGLSTPRSGMLRLMGSRSRATARMSGAPVGDAAVAVGDPSDCVGDALGCVGAALGSVGNALGSVGNASGCGLGRVVASM